MTNPTTSLPKNASTALLSLKTAILELALTPLMRQLSEDFQSEGGIRLPRCRAMRQQAKFAQARRFLSVVSIKSDTVGFALVEKGGDGHLSGCPEKVCELRIGLCPVIAGVNGTDGMEELSADLSKIR